MYAYNMIVSVALCAATAPTLAGEFFLQEADFLDAASVIDTNPFDDVVSGAQGSYAYSTGDYGYTISSIDAQGGGLSNGDGFVRLADANQSMLITFTGAPVTAFSGNFWGMDDAGSTGAGAYIIIDISNGDEFIHSSTSHDNFFSYASDTAFTSVEIAFSGGASEHPVYASVDNFLIGTTVPTPGTLAMVALAGMGATRRRRD